jgi:hypothetical protein
MNRKALLRVAVAVVLAALALPMTEIPTSGLFANPLPSLLATMILPVVLTAWFRFRTLTTEESEKASEWFPSGVRHTDGHLLRVDRARVTFSRMSEAFAVQMMGFGV